MNALADIFHKGLVCRTCDAFAIEGCVIAGTDACVIGEVKDCWGLAYYLLDASLVDEKAVG